MQIEKIFSVLEMTEKQKVPLVAFVLIGEVEHLWRLKRDLLPTPTIWAHFLEAFYQNIFPTWVCEKKEVF